MPSTNHFKFGASELLSATRGGFAVGVKSGTDYGPTSLTGFWNGITPPVGGYTIYVDKASQGPSIHVASDDAQCIGMLLEMGATGSTIGNVLAWASAQSNMAVLTAELTLGDLPGAGPSIVTSGLVLNLDAGNASSYSGTGTTWTDLSGNGNTGTLVGGTSYSSGNGGSITFAGNGSNSYVSIPNFDLGSGDFAYETWAYSTSYTPGHFFTLNGNNQQYAAIRLQMNNNSSNPGFAIYNSYDGSSWANTYDSTTTTVPLNTWVNIIVTRVSGTMKVYVNAVEEYSVSLSGSLLASSGSVLSAIGKLQQYPNDSSFHFAGNIAVARLYQNKGLNSTEVTQNFNAIKSRFGL